MECVAAGDTAHRVVVTARRNNNSLSSSGRSLAFGFILAVSLGIAAAFACMIGAWPILPFSGVEMLVLYLAFRHADLHSCDYERVAFEEDKVAVEVLDGGRVTRRELNRYWAQVVCSSDGSKLALRSHGRQLEIGRHLDDGQRVALARELRQGLRGAT